MTLISRLVYFQHTLLLAVRGRLVAGCRKTPLVNFQFFDQFVQRPLVVKLKTTRIVSFREPINTDNNFIT